LPVPLEEKLEILIVLSGDRDEATRQKAAQTLQSWNHEELCRLLSDSATPASVIEYMADHLVPGQQDLVEALLRNPGLASNLAERFQPPSAPAAEAPPSGDAAAAAAETPAEESAEGGEKEQKRVTLLQRINAMTPSQKIKTALTGNQEERLLLIRDSNKLVARAVLGSPKLSDAEVEAFASMKNVTEEVLRQIAMNRAFMKGYSVVRALANNPRTPLDVSLPLINRINERDLKTLSMNKNVPETLRGLAAKMYKQKNEPKQTKLPGKH
jgi:hypothetical protein